MHQRDVRVRERHRQHARSGGAVAILAHQRQRRLAIVLDPGCEGHADERARRHAHALAQRSDRIEHRTRGARERTVERERVLKRAATADEARTVRLPLDGAAETAIDAQDVIGPYLRLVGRSRTPAEEQPRAGRVVFRFDEQLPECRMGEVVLRPPQDDLGVAGNLDLPRPVAPVGDRQPSHLDVVFRRHRDLQLRLEIAVTPAIRHLVELQRRFVLVRLTAYRLIGRRPDEARSRIPEIDVLSADVRGAIFTLTGDREPSPRAEAAACVRQSRCVTAVRQEMRVRARRVW